MDANVCVSAGGVDTLVYEIPKTIRTSGPAQPTQSTETTPCSGWKTHRFPS